MTRLSVILLLALLGLSCGAGGRAKGGLEPLPGVSAGQVDEALRPRRLALLVGINTFQDDRWPALRHASADATALGEILQDPGAGHFDTVELLADPEGTTLGKIQSAVEALQRRNQSAEDTVLVYFSTHGTLARGPGGELARYLVTSDTDQDHIQTTALQVRSLLAQFEALSSRRKVLILASCHSGSGKSVLPAPIAGELSGIKGAFFVRPLEETSQAAMVLTACAWGETAREDDQLGHDIYTHFLLQALQNGDSDGDGAVTASEAHAQAMARTYYFSGGHQRPQVESTVLGADPIVLTGRRVRPADPVLFSFMPRLSGLRVEVDGRDKGELPSRLVLAPGSHRVVVLEEGQEKPLLDENVDLSSGDEVAVETLLMRKAPHWVLGVRGGYQLFLDEKTRDTLVAPAPIFGVSFTRRDFPLSSLETGLDFGMGGGRQRLTIGGLPVTQDLVEITYGLFVLYRLDLGPVALLGGPHLAGLHLLRHTTAPKSADQRFFNFSPGLLTKLRWTLGWGLSLDVEARLHFFTVHTDSDNLDLGYLDLFGGLGWSF